MVERNMCNAVNARYCRPAGVHSHRFGIHLGNTGSKATRRPGEDDLRSVILRGYTRCGRTHEMNPKIERSEPWRNPMLLKRNLLLAGGVALAVTCGFQGANAQGVFTITSKSFKDGERLATKMAGNNKQNPNCVGDNISPELSWANPPAGTKSFALLMFDPEGRPPGGVSHWVAYGIAPTVTGFAEGEASKQTDKYVGAAVSRPRTCEFS